MANPLDVAKQWLFKVAIKKAITRAIPYVVTGAVVVAAKINAVTSPAGVTFSVDEAAFGLFAAQGLAIFQNWAKTKFGIKWL